MTYSGPVKQLDILHFNDVYDIIGKPIQKGLTEDTISPTKNNAVASRFATAWKEHGMEDKLCLFSGDLFSPSLCK